MLVPLIIFFLKNCFNLLNVCVVVEFSVHQQKQQKEGKGDCTEVSNKVKSRNGFTLIKLR